MYTSLKKNWVGMQTHPERPDSITQEEFSDPSGHWLSGIAGSNPVGGMIVCLANVVCCQVQVSASDCSLVQRRPAECCMSECDRESSIRGRHCPSSGRCTTGEKKKH
jgi:hypothetical protein